MVVGRYAPSPTGPLHFGSLVAALAGWLEARAAGGRWLVRIEDLDPPREQPGAADEILRQLEACGLDWDGMAQRQSRFAARHAEAISRLRAAELAYDCGCSRREIADSVLLPAADGARVYPGTCRAGLAPGRTPRAVRVRTDATPIIVDDRVQGRSTHSLAREVGDFVLRRADGFVAYQLAVVVDDGTAGVTDVVRGADLLDSTPRQIHLQRLLGLARPRYAHVPVAVNAAGEKLAKQTRAPAAGAGSIPAALAFLGHAPPPDLTPPEALAWARACWSIDRVPKRRTQPAPPQAGGA